MSAISADNNRLRLAVRYLVLILIAVIFCFPLVFMVVSSFKPSLQLLQDASNLRAFLPVGDISLNNYGAIFDRAPVGLFHLQFGVRHCCHRGPIASFMLCGWFCFRLHRMARPRYGAWYHLGDIDRPL